MKVIRYSQRPRPGNIFGSFSVTTWIIIFTSLFSFFAFIVQYARPELIKHLALYPEHIANGQYLWTLISHIFVHGSLPHLFFNMFSLFFIGNLLEKIMGRKRFFWFYLIAGVFAGLVFVTLSNLFGYGVLGQRMFSSPDIPGVGASGAIFGIAGVLAFLIPRSKVYLIGGPLIAIALQAVVQSLFGANAAVNLIIMLLNIYILLSLLFIFSFNPNLRRLTIPIAMPFWLLPIVAILPLFIVGMFVSLPIANTAHLGGAIAGAIFGYYLRVKYKKKIAMLGRFFR